MLDNLPKINAEKLLLVIRNFFWVLLSLLILLFIIVIIKDLRNDRYVVQTFQVPESFEKSGYTGQVLANHLIDKVNELNQDIRTRKEDSLQIEVDLELDLNLELMGLGLSVKSINHYLRSLFNIETKEIRGELLDKDSILQLVLRVSGFPNFKMSRSFKNSTSSIALEEILEGAGKRILYYTDPYRLAVLEYNLGNYDATEQLVREIIKTRSRDRKWAFHIWGNLKQVKGEYERAKVYYLKSLELDPDFELPNQQLGWYYYRIQDFEKAIGHFEKCLELNPKNFGAANGKALSFMRMGETEKAGKAYLHNIEHNPDNFWAYNNYARYLLSSEKDTQSYQQLLASAQSRMEIDENYYVLMGEYYKTKGTGYLDSVEYFAQQALDYAPGSMPALYLQIDVLSRREDYEQLENYWKLSIRELKRQNFDSGMLQNAYNSLAMNDYHLQKYDSALVHVQKAIEISPKNPYPWTTLAETYAYMGDAPKFYEAFEKSLKLGFDVGPYENEQPYNRFSGEEKFKQLKRKYAYRLKQ